VSPATDRPHGHEVAVHVEDLTVRYREAAALWDVDIDVPVGVLAGIVGPNGAGKSTLLKSIVGLLAPSAGHVRVFGRHFREVRRRVAYVPQRSAVDWDFPTTVLDVVMMGRYAHLGWFRRPGARERTLAGEALSRLGLDGLADRQIGELSGGQQQRVFLARALVQDADLYLMDEPLAGVDAPTERTIIATWHDLRSRGKTVVVVHHDLQTVSSTFDWLALVNVRLVAAGPVQEVFTAERLRAAYGGQVAIVSAEAPASTEGPASAEAPASTEAAASAEGAASAEAPASTDREAGAGNEPSAGEAGAAAGPGAASGPRPGATR
jgi:manganese/zinc/iron transport system ATP- binding protein